MKHFRFHHGDLGFYARQPREDLPGPAPLESPPGDKHNYAFTATLDSKLWLVYTDDKDEWQAKERSRRSAMSAASCQSTLVSAPMIGRSLSVAW